MFRNILLVIPKRWLRTPQSPDCPLRVPSNTPSDVAFLSSDSALHYYFSPLAFRGKPEKNECARVTMSPYRRQRFNDTTARALQCRKTPFVRTLPCPKIKFLTASLAIVYLGSTWLRHPSGHWAHVSLRSSCAGGRIPPALSEGGKRV